jgi:hypothetical protein
VLLSLVVVTAFFRDQSTKDWRKCYNKKLNNLYSKPNIVRAIRSTGTRWVEHITWDNMGEMRNACAIFISELQGKRARGKPGRARRVILKLVLEKSGVK